MQRCANFEELENEKLGSQKELIDKLNGELSDAAQQREALEARIKELEEQLSTDADEDKHNKMRRCMVRMLNLRHIWTEQAFLIWKRYEPPVNSIADIEKQIVDFADPEVDAQDLAKA